MSPGDPQPLESRRGRQGELPTSGVSQFRQGAGSRSSRASRAVGEVRGSCGGGSEHRKDFRNPQ